MEAIGRFRQRRLRRGSFSFAVIALGLAAPLAQASACVPQPYLMVEPRASGAPGTKLEVAGTNFEEGPPEIRWNAVDGVLLGKATTTEFKLTVTVPEDQEGLYALVAVSRSPQGHVTGVARASFAVTNSGSANDVARSRPEPVQQTRTYSVASMVLGAALTTAGGVAGTLLARRRMNKPTLTSSG